MSPIAVMRREIGTQFAHHLLHTASTRAARQFSFGPSSLRLQPHRLHYYDYYDLC